MTSTKHCWKRSPKKTSHRNTAARARSNWATLLRNGPSGISSRTTTPLPTGTSGAAVGLPIHHVLFVLGDRYGATRDDLEVMLGEAYKRIYWAFQKWVQHDSYGRPMLFFLLLLCSSMKTSPSWTPPPMFVALHNLSTLVLPEGPVQVILGTGIQPKVQPGNSRPRRRKPQRLVVGSMALQ
jgi:hypothetical protein